MSERPSEIDLSLKSELSKHFVGLDPKARRGQCLVYSGELKIDSQQADIYFPDGAAMLDKNARNGLAGLFDRYRSLANPALQDVMQLQQTRLTTKNGKVSVLTLIHCGIPVLQGADSAGGFTARVTLFKMLVQGVATLHQAGLVHGNIHPASIRRENETGIAKLCDFAFTTDPKVAVLDQPLLYQSPQIIAEGTASPQSDLHALGMLGYRLFLGPNGPLHAVTGDRIEVSDQILRQRITAADAPNIPAEMLSPEDPTAARYLAPVLSRMIGKSEQAFKSGAEALQALGGPEMQSSKPHIAPIAPPPPIEDTNPWKRYAVIGACVAAVAGIAWYGYSSYHNTQLQAALDRSLQECRLDADLPAGLTHVQANYMAVINDQYETRNLEALQAACTRKPIVAGLTVPFNAAMTAIARAEGYLSLTESPNLTIPDDSVAALETRRSALLTTIETLSIAAPEALGTATDALVSETDSFAGVAGTVLQDRAADVQLMLATLRAPEPLSAQAQALAERADNTLEAPFIAETAEVLSGLVAETVAERRTSWTGALADILQSSTDRLTQIGTPASIAESALNTILQAQQDLQAGLDPFPSPEAAVTLFDAQLTRGKTALAQAEEQTLMARLEGMEDKKAHLAVALLPDPDGTQALETALTQLRNAADKTGPNFDALSTDLAALGDQTDTRLAELSQAASEAGTALQNVLGLADRAAGPVAELQASLAPQIETAQADVARGAFTLATQTRSAVIVELEQELAAFTQVAQAAIAEAQTHLTAAEGYALPIVAEAQENLAQAEGLISEGALSAAQSLGLQTASDLQAAIAAHVSGPRTFGVGATASERQLLQNLCAQSRVPSTCASGLSGLGSERMVELSPFALDLAEATVAEFRAFVTNTGYQTTAELSGTSYAVFSTGPAEISGASWRTPNGPGSAAIDSAPVTALSGSDAAAYCAALGKRLPTASEWEVTARGADNHAFPWGDQWQANAAIWQGAGAALRTSDAAGGATLSGHLAMAGNVREWVAADASETAQAIGVMGGSWLSVHPHELGSGAFVPQQPTLSGLDFGVRCAKDLEQWPNN